MTEVFTCPLCNLEITAADQDSLQWGVSSHVCGPVDALGEAVVDYLVGSYGRPFWLVRVGFPRVLVT